jgi:hypothetical protein
MEEGIEDAELSELTPQREDAAEEDKVPGMMPVSEHGHGLEHKTGIPWLDGIIAASVIFISLLSLAVSIEHGKRMKEMVEQNQKLVVASTLPLLSMTGNNIDPVTHKPQSKILLMNDGVGPAIIVRFEFRYKGVAYNTPDTLFSACCAQEMSTKGHFFVYGNVSGGVLPARETRDLITITLLGTGDQLIPAFEEARKDMSFSACYCSVLDECWVTNFDERRPQPVKECKVAPGDKLW